MTPHDSSPASHGHAREATRYDLLLKGGKVYDPTSGQRRRLDIDTFRLECGHRTVTAAR